MERMQLKLAPSMEKPTFKGYLLSKVIITRFREMLENGEIKMDTRGKKRAKQELVNLVRRETGNEMCMADVAETINNAVNEYIDCFFECVYSRELENGAYLMTILIRRIEDEVWHVKRVAQ